MLCNYVVASSGIILTIICRLGNSTTEVIVMEAK